jgi:hypothetical protein
VRETAPATPPATNEARTGCAKIWRARWKLVRSGVPRGCDHESIDDLRPECFPIHTTTLFPGSSFMIETTGCGCGCSGVFDILRGQRCRRVLEDRCGRSEEKVYRKKEKVAQRNVEVIGRWCFGNLE